MTRFLSKLPHCADVTRQYCQKFSGILLVDGKYLSVGEYKRKIPVVYGVDYTTHDIPHYLLSKAENYVTCKQFFTSLNLMGYPLQAVVCDDNRNIYETAKYAFPNVTVQLCHVHYLRNLRHSLELDQKPNYISFFQSLKTLFLKKYEPQDFNQRARKLLLSYQHDKQCVNILLEIERKREYLFGYITRRGTPLTTNLIECFNSHLQGRIAGLKGFDSFKQADLWLNGYFLRRRTKKFTDCITKFKHLNGKISLQLSQKPGIDLPVFF